MKKYKVGIIGGTGMVGQRFVTLMEDHPWFQLTAIELDGSQHYENDNMEKDAERTDYLKGYGLKVIS